MSLAPGATLGRYQILAQLGQGGMATVYKAFQPMLDRTVALKVMRAAVADDPEFLERFLREAKAIARLRHPNIVQVHDFDEVDGRHFMAMEYLEGGTLKAKLAELRREDQRLPPREVARIVAEVAEALAYAHGLGIVHRDVKPSNVMLTRDGRSVVTDFGIAKVLSATQMTQTGVGVGTPEYMSPEQGQGKQIDHRSDIYALGVMAYEMLAGRVPFTADTPLAIVLAHVRDPLPLPSSINPDVGEATERALLKALAKTPEERYASATDFANALTQGIAEDERGATIPTMVVRRPATTAPAAARTTAALAPRPVAARRLPISRLPISPLALAAVAAIAVLSLGGALVLSRTLFAPPSVPATGAPAAVPAATAAPVATPVAAAATAPAAPVLAGPPGVPTTARGLPPEAKGALVYQALLDAPSSGAFKTATTGGASVTFGRPGVHEMQIASTGSGEAKVVLPERARLTFVSETDLSIARGSELFFQQLVRTAPGHWYAASIDPANMLRFEYSTGAAPLVLAGPVPVPVGEVRAVTLAVVMEAARYTVYVDGAQVAQASDSRIGVSTDPIQFVVLARPGGGSVRITGVRIYELPRR